MLAKLNMGLLLRSFLKSLKLIITFLVVFAGAMGLIGAASWLCVNHHWFIASLLLFTLVVGIITAFNYLGDNCNSEDE